MITTRRSAVAVFVLGMSLWVVGGLWAQVPDRNRLYLGPPRPAEEVARIHADRDLCVIAINGERDLDRNGREVEVLPGSHGITATNCHTRAYPIRLEAEAGHVYRLTGGGGAVVIDSTIGRPVASTLTASILEDPYGIMYKADDGHWYRLPLSVGGQGVLRYPGQRKWLVLPYAWTPQDLSDLLHWWAGWPIWLETDEPLPPPHRSDQLMPNQRVRLYSQEGTGVLSPSSMPSERVEGELFVLDGTDLVVRRRNEVFAVIEGDSTAPLVGMATSDIEKLTGIAHQIARTLADSQITRLDRVRMFFVTADDGLVAEFAGRTRSGQRPTLTFAESASAEAGPTPRPAASVRPETTRSPTRSEWEAVEIGSSELAHQAVGGLAVSPDGALWVGTTLGVARLQGGRWDVFTTASSGVPLDYVTVLMLGPDGTLWVGTRNGLTRMKDGQWQAFTSASSGLPDDWVSALALGADGELWVGTLWGGLALLKDDQWQVFAPGPSGLQGPSVRAVAVAPDSALWVACEGEGAGVSRLHHGEWTVVTHDLVGLRDDWERRVGSLAFEPDGALWIGTFEGLLRFHEGQWHALTPGAGGLFADDAVIALAVAPDGVVWAGTDESGLGRLHDGRWQVFTSGSEGRAFNGVHALALAPDGVLWLGTDAGLARVRSP